MIRGIWLYRAARQSGLFSWMGMIPLPCRFYPTCSQYAEEAVARYGVWKGIRLGFHRLLRCHPFKSGGWDPVVGGLME